MTTPAGSTPLVSIEQMQELMPSVLEWNGKPRSDAAFSVVAANKFNVERIENGQTVGLKPNADWTGFDAYPIKLDKDGKPVKFALVTASSPIKRETRAAIDSLASILDAAVESVESTDDTDTD